MERKFNVGDRVRIVCPGSPYHGTECTVTSGLRPAEICILGKFVRSGDLVHELDEPPRFGGDTVIAKPQHLRPIYDGDERASWSDCVWKPNKITAC